MPPRPKWTKEVTVKVKEKSGGRCHHCSCVIDLENRQAWNIDHFPVLYRDIEDQICCGVTDPRDTDNLVLACRKCNVSHKYESTPYCRGRYSQYPCKRRWMTKANTFLLGAFTGATVTWVVATWS